MSMSELLQATSMFASGLQQLGVTAGINQATNQIDQINQSAMDEMQKRQARMQAAHQLALSMVSNGANAQQVQQASQAVAGQQASTPEEMMAQGVQMGDQSMIDNATKIQKFNNQSKLDQIEAQGKNETAKANVTGQYELEKARIMANGKDLQKFTQTITKPFDTQSKDIVSKLNGLDSSETLSSLQNPVADTAVRSTLARVVGSEKGKIPIQEMMLYAGSPEAKNVIARFFDKNLSGQVFTEKDRQLVQQTLATAKAKAEGQLGDLIKMHAGRAEANGLMDKDEAAKRLVGGDPRMQRLAGLNQPQAAAGGAPSAPTDQNGQALPPGIPPGSRYGSFNVGGQFRAGYKTPDGKYLFPKTQGASASGNSGSW